MQYQTYRVPSVAGASLEGVHSMEAFYYFFTGQSILLIGHLNFSQTEITVWRKENVDNYTWRFRKQHSTL